MILFRDSVLIYFNNIYNLFFEKNDYKSAEIIILEEKVKYLENEYKELSNFKENISFYANYNYLVSRVIYKENYLYNSNIYIEGGKSSGINTGMAVVNEYGLVGVIGKVSENTSELLTLTNTYNLSVNIGDYYGKLTYDGENLKIEDISRDANINLNDEVYTSTLGSIKEKIYIGKVVEVNDKTIEKDIVIKTNVDFNKLNYLLIVGDL